MRRDRYALPAHSEDACNQLLRHDQLVRLSPIETQEKTAAESLINRVQSVADGGLGELGQQGLRIQ